MNEPQNKPTVRSVCERDFEAAVLQSSKPVLVAFCAAWSRPCRIADSVLAAVLTSCAGDVEVVRVDADANPNLSFWYGVQSIPTLLYFVNGNLCERLVGTASKGAILTLLRRHCSIDSRRA